MPNVHSNYKQARERYGESVADAIWHKFEDLYGKRGKSRNAVVNETEHEILSQKPAAATVAPIIDAVVERS